MESGKCVALYCRVSTAIQNKGLESQERALREYCEKNSICKFRVFTDKNVSGAKSSRPALDQMMKEIEDGQVSTVIVFSFSRFARSTRHLLDALEYFRSKEVEFVSISEQIDTTTSLGRLVFTFISALAQFERELVSERVKNGLQNAKSKGKKLGSPKRRPSKAIQELHLAGMPYRKIAAILGISHSTVAREVHESGLSNKPRVAKK